MIGLLKDYISMAARNVRRGKSRSFLTSLAIAIGIAAVVLLTAIGESGKTLIYAQLENIGINGIMVFSGESSSLSIQDGERIHARIAEVASCMPFETCIGTYSIYAHQSSSCVLIGVDERLDEYMRMDVLYGRLFTANECKNGSKVCVVGSELAQKNYQRDNIVGKKIIITNDGISDEYEIIGVVHATLNRFSSVLGFQIPGFLYVPYSAITTDDDIGQLAVKVNGDNPDTAVRQIESLLRKTKVNGKSFQVENLSGYMHEFDAVLGLLTGVLSATAAISLFVAGIGIMNAMFATVSDRRSEIGICKAIGADAWQIALTFLLETMMLTLLGGIGGLIFGLAVAAAVFAFLGTSLTLNIYAILLPCLITLTVGLLSGILPAVSAARLQPIIAIRKES
ncbi:MAG: ABC transporter permease [Eubacteriales bacterium]|nr:ABC transporter permease [Eubacteriales bacterium]